MTRDIINPQMKVGDLLAQYPELEETLVAIAPAFEKLKNPVLRRTIAGVATLQQAALTGNVPIAEVINRLRAAAGQDEGAPLPNETEQMSTNTEIPEWLSAAAERIEFDARPLLESGAHPLQAVFAHLKDLPDGAVLDLVTPFHPAPLVEAVRTKGWLTHSGSDVPGRFVTSIGKA